MPSNKNKTDAARNIDIRATLKHQQKEMEQTNKLLKELLEKINNLAENSPLSAQKKKKVRDPNRPKKNKNGYMFFCQENRSQVKDKNPNIDGKDLVKILSGMWNKMNTKERAPYQAKADQDKVRYQKEMVTYNSTQTTS